MTVSRSAIFKLKLFILSFADDDFDLRSVFSVSFAHGRIKEAWLEFVGDSFDLRTGNQIVSWGSSDGVNPTDVWNPSDLIDLFNSTKLPVELIKLSIHPLSMEHVI